MHSLPLALKRLVKRLEKVEDLSQQDLTSVLFVVRLGDSLHRAFYGTFLTLSLIEELCAKLGIPDLTLELDMFTTRWNFRQGTVTTAHRIGFDYDMETVSVLSKIGWSVLEGKMTSKEGLEHIRTMEINMEKPRYERWYREFPGRAFVFPLMAATCAAVYFGGTWYDLGFAAISGLVSGGIAWLGTLHEQWASVADYLAAILTAMIAVGSIVAFPDSTCFSAQELGTLYWFLYGTAYVVAIYEISNNQVIVGVTRLFAAITKSYGLAFGVLLGIWFSAYDDDRFVQVVTECSEKDSQIRAIWFLLLFPLSAIACLMQFRVKLGDFFICFIVQTLTYGSQYLIGTVWGQPDFFANLVPAFVAPIASHFCIMVAHWFNLSNLQVGRNAYREKKTDGDEMIMSNETTGHSQDMTDSNQIQFFNFGWAEKQAAGGYTRADKLTYPRSDLWFCLLPALYLLVPGSKLLQDSLSSFFDGIISSLKAQGLSGALLVIGLGQVVGLRLGFATLWIGSVLWERLVKRCLGKKRSKRSDSEQQPSPHTASLTWSRTPRNGDGHKNRWQEQGDDRDEEIQQV